MSTIARSLPHLLTVLVVALGLMVWWQSTQGFRAFTWETYRRIQVAEHPVVVPEVQFEDQQSRVFDLASLHGKVLVVNFIYTRCPTICGYTGMAFSKLQTKIAEKGYDNKVYLLSISLDPHHDTPHYLERYLMRFTRHPDKNWLAVRPTKLQQGQNLLQQLGVVSIPDGMGGISHNAAIHIVDQKGRLVKIIDEDKIGEAMNLVEHLLEHSQTDYEDAL
jgi:protein SCO1/2